MMRFDPIYISICSDPANLKKIRQLMARVTSNLCLSKAEASSIILAVDEACSNIIKHCCKKDRTRLIELTVTLTKNLLTVSIVDNGTLFDIDSIKPRDVTDIKPGGLGVHIIKSVMDSVSYTHTPGRRNKITMTKKIPTRKIEKPL